MTWLELMMLFVMRGGTLEPRGTPMQQHQALPMPNILLAIQLFKRVVKEVLNLYGGPVARCFFKPSKNGYHRLSPWQITNHLPCASFIAYMTEPEQVKVAQAIISFRCCINRKTAITIDQGTLYLAPAPLRGKFDWGKHFAPNGQLADESLRHRRESAQQRAQELGSQEPPHAITLRRAVCNTSRTAKYNRLLSTKGWKRLWCVGTCRRAWLSKKWKCTCELPWHQCLVHSQGDYTIQPKPTTRSPARHRPAQPAQCPQPAKKAKCTVATSTTQHASTASQPAHEAKRSTASTRTTPLLSHTAQKRAKHAHATPCSSTHATHTTPAASSNTPDSTPLDPRTRLKRKAIPSETSEQLRSAGKQFQRAKLAPNGPGFQERYTSSAPVQVSSDALPNQTSGVDTGNQGQKRAATLLHTILAKSAKLGEKFKHLKR